MRKKADTSKRLQFSPIPYNESLLGMSIGGQETVFNLLRN